MILIGTELEQAIAAIVCCYGLTIEWSVLDQIEDDCRENQRDAKQYSLHSSRHACLSAAVDEYEPETVRLNLAGHRSEPFNSIITAASTPGFGQHPFFLGKPIDAPKPIADSIETALNASHPSETFARFRLVAFRGLDAITRCFLAKSKLIPTPYVVCSTNIRTMESRQLVEDESTPYAIKGYR
jgi:hypothetical protein